MTYKFVPNQFAREKFNLAAEYTAPGMTPVLEQALGKGNYDRYMVAQDPLAGGRSSGEISIILNPDERSPSRMSFASIGTIYKI